MGALRKTPRRKPTTALQFAVLEAVALDLDHDQRLQICWSARESPTGQREDLRAAEGTAAEVEDGERRERVQVEGVDGGAAVAAEVDGEERGER